MPTSEDTTDVKGSASRSLIRANRIKAGNSGTGVVNRRNRRTYTRQAPATYVEGTKTTTQEWNCGCNESMRQMPNYTFIAANITVKCVLIMFAN